VKVEFCWWDCLSAFVCDSMYMAYRPLGKNVCYCFFGCCSHHFFAESFRGTWCVHTPPADNREMLAIGFSGPNSSLNWALLVSSSDFGTLPVQFSLVITFCSKCLQQRWRFGSSIFNCNAKLYENAMLNRNAKKEKLSCMNISGKSMWKLVWSYLHCEYLIRSKHSVKLVVSKYIDR